MKKVFVCVTLMSIVLISCSKSNEESVRANNTGSTGTPAGSCDTADMKYATHVQPIIQANCYSCHGNGQAQSGVTLDTYNGVKTQVNNNNTLLNVITHASGYPAMPEGSPKLSDCDINKIKDWIARGTNNN